MIMERRIFVLAGALALAAVTALPAVAKQKIGAGTFVNGAGVRGLANVELSQLALQRSQNPEVRRLARTIVDDHLHAVDDLFWLAGPEDSKMPKTIDLEQRGIKSRLTTLTGVAFDRAYLQAIATNSARDIALYRTYAKAGGDPGLKEWAAERLPALRKQQQLATATSAALR